MSLKRVEIIDTGPSVGDWTIKVNDVDITDMVGSIGVHIDRSERKPTVSIVFSPDTLILPKILQAETDATIQTKSTKPITVKDK